MFNYLSNKIESNIQLTFIILLFFHAFFAIFLFLLASSEYFSNFHNGEGLWNFTRDSWKYHKEAVNSVYFLQNSEWASWWNAYSIHAHIRYIALVYWLIGYETPIVFEIVNGFVWTASIILIYRSSKLLFENNTVVPILTVLFFLQPSLLISSTQLLRDPFQILGLCFICYGWILIAKTELHHRAVLYIVLGSVLYIAMRQYLGMVVLGIFSSYAVYLLLTKKITLVNTAIILLSLSLTVFMNLDTGSKRVSNTFFAEVDYRNEFNTSEISINQWINRTFTSLLQGFDTDPINKQNLLTQFQQIEEMYREPRLDKMMRSVRLKEIKLIANTLSDLTVFETILERILKTSSKNDKKLESLYASMKNSKELLLIRHNQLLINEEEWLGQNAMYKFFDVTAWRMLEVRSDFRWVNRNAFSKVDPILEFSGFVDAILYLPRAFQVSFLSPFPVNWIEEGRHVGRIGRLLSGLEMLVWYVVFIGFIYGVVNASSRTIPLIPVLILSTFVIILVGYAVPNMGAIFRMRQDQIIPFYLIGIYGLYSITNRLNKKRSLDS